MSEFARNCVGRVLSTDPSLLWSTYYQKYLLLGTTSGNDRDGWSLQLSDDLISWSQPEAVDTKSLNATGGPGGNTSTLSQQHGA